MENREFFPRVERAEPARLCRDARANVVIYLAFHAAARAPAVTGRCTVCGFLRAGGGCFFFGAGNLPETHGVSDRREKFASRDTDGGHDDDSIRRWIAVLGIHRETRSLGRALVGR